MATVKIRKPRPLFRAELKDAPAHPLGERVLVREFPVEAETEGGLALADVAKQHYYAGTLVAVGDQAADKLYDIGVEIGDEIWYAKYAGIVEKWQHIVADGNDPNCVHDSAWEFVPKDDPAWKTCITGEPNENMELRACRTCGAKKLSERVILLSVDDLALDVDLQVRLERGEVQRVRDVDSEGRTRYVLKRIAGHTDSLEIRKER